MTIHKEGRGLLIKLFAIGIGVYYGAFYFLSNSPVLLYSSLAVYTVFFLIVLQFFREPNRELIQDEGKIIAPVDGKVVVIEETDENEFFKDKRIQVSIFMSPINVHQTRVPVGGLVKYFKYHPGKYLVAWHPKSSTDNERTTAVIETKDGTQILFRQIAGALAKRICWYIKEGDKIGQSEEYGFIKFGSRVDVFLPVGTKVLAELNQVTKGGQTVIAEL
jgi:phosphatidylserine decarboxylase